MQCKAYTKEMSMKRILSLTTIAAVLIFSAVSASADSIVFDEKPVRLSFPDLSGQMVTEATVGNDVNADPSVQMAVWPFSGKEDSGESGALQPKSTRKAFFLSMLIPGLGETYVGSKRGIFFFAVEAFSWWMYTTNTNEGKDLEKDFHRYADSHWHYTSTTASDGAELDHNYWKWLQYHFRQVDKPDDIDPYDFATVNAQLESTVQNSNSSIFGHSIHNLPSTKTQQYYEMIGKYPQFVYGWEDVADPLLNPTIINEQDDVNFNVAVNLVKSNMRMHYEDMRDDSNQKLKAGQRGIHVMILSRVVSAVHAGRLAYKHNQSLKSELSTIDVDVVEKFVIDNRVPMLMVTKRF